MNARPEGTSTAPDPEIGPIVTGSWLVADMERERTTQFQIEAAAIIAGAVS
jgi:hypothetical protein